MGIDGTERKISYIGGGLALLLAAIFVPHLVHNTKVIDTAKLTSLHRCPTGYKLVGAVCQHSRIAHPSAYVLQFLLIIVFGAAIRCSCKMLDAGLAGRDWLLAEEAQIALQEEYAFELLH